MNYFFKFKDQTGFAPEKEKGGGNKLQEALTMETSYQEYWMELIRQLEMQQARYLERMLGYDAEKMNEFLSKIPVGGGGGRTGKIESKNGIEERKDNGEDTFTLNDDQRNEVESNIELVVDDNTKDPDNIRLNFWQKFWDANSEMTQEEYEYYTGKYFCVTVKNADDFIQYSKDNNGAGTELGWGGGTENGIFLTFGENIFYDDFVWDDGKHSYPYITSDIFGKYTDYIAYDLTSVIQHEFGHGYAYWTLGYTDYYKIADSDMRENWAIWYTNWSYRMPLNDNKHFPLEKFKP